MVCDFLGRNVKYLNFDLCRSEDDIKRIICGQTMDNKVKKKKEETTDREVSE